MVTMTYTQGLNRISELIFSVLDKKRGLYGAGDDNNIQMLLLHMYRFHKFDDILDSMQSDADIFKAVNDICRTSNEGYGLIAEQVEKALTLCNPHRDDYIYFLKELSTISSEWYEEHIAKLFDDLLQRLTDSKSTSEYGQPKELSKLIYSLADIHTGDTIYDPFAGLSSFGVDMPSGCHYCGQEKSHTVYMLSVLRLMAHGVTDFELYNEDSLQNWRSRTYPDDTEIPLYDWVISFPPIGVRTLAEETDFEYEWPASYISLSDYLISNGSCGLSMGAGMVGVFSMSTLFAGGPTGKQRESLIKSGLIDTVIELPAGLLSGTSIPLCIIIFGKNVNRDGRVRMINATTFVEKVGRRNVLQVDRLLQAIEDGDEEVVRNVTISEIEERDYTIDPAGFFAKEEVIDIPAGFKLVELKDIVSVDSGKKIEAAQCLCVKGADLSSGGTIKPLDVTGLSKAVLRNGFCKILTSDAILVLKVGRLKPTLYKKGAEDVTCNPNVVGLRCGEDIYPEYLISELRKDYVTNQVKARLSGIIPSIRIPDLLSIQVLMPENIEQQKSSYENELRLLREQDKKVAEASEIVRRERERIFQLMSIRRHRINPYFSGLESNIRMIFDEFNERGQMQLKTEIGPDWTLEDALHNMQESLSSMRVLFKELTTLVDVGVAENLLLPEFLSSYSYTPVSPDRKFRISVESRKEDKKLPAVSFNRDNLKEILDELVHNAEKHFEKGTINGVVKLDARAEGDRVLLYILNNGEPLPADFDEKRSFTAGYHIGDAEGTGMGLFRVKQVCEEFGADIAWSNDPDSLTPVGLCVTFKQAEE